MLSKFKKKIKGINILRTIYANFAYLPFKTAIKFPIFIYGKTNIRNKKGSINIEPGIIRAGILNIDMPILGFQDKKAITTLSIKGKMNIMVKSS